MNHTDKYSQWNWMLDIEDFLLWRIWYPLTIFILRILIPLLKNVKNISLTSILNDYLAVISHTS